MFHRGRAIVALRAAAGCTLLALWVAALSCGGGSTMVAPPPAPQSDSDPGAYPLPGTPELLAGLTAFPLAGEPPPLPRQTAQAGVDFASNRFIVIFENSPQPAALAPFIGGGPSGVAADVIEPTDNLPLVQHQFYRQVSRNLGDHYGLTQQRRVFFRSVNFTVYELPGVSDVSQLDAMMRRMLAENPGLVREVCYDMFVHALAEAEPMGGRQLTRAEQDDLLADNPVGLKPLAEITRRVSAPPNDPMHINRSGSGGGTWANWRVGAVDGQAWDRCIGGTDVLVAVLDTGVRWTHEDLVDNVIEPAATAPFNAPGILTNVIAKTNIPSDGHGHGTNCAGCIGARGNNGVGLAGINQIARILPIKVLSDGGSGSDGSVAEGMLLANYLGVNILNLSLGGSFPNRVTQLSIEQTAADGCLVVVSAGNGNVSAPSYPTYYPDALSIGATTLINSTGAQDFSGGGDLTGLERYDGRVGFSHYGRWVDIAAPGIEVRTTSRLSDTAYTPATAGTSFSCPYVVGCAALLWQYIINEGGAPTADEIRGLLLSSAEEMTVLPTGANPRGFLDNNSNGTVRHVNVNAAMDLYDAGGVDAPSITWDNPLDDETVSGTQELRISVDAPESIVLNVQFETPTRHLGTVTTLDDGFYKLDWDTTFEFNRAQRVTALVYDDKGNISRSTITVTPDNTRVEPPWLEEFTSLGDDDMPAGWFQFDGNQGTTNTSWGANTSAGDAAAPSMKSTGSSTTWAAQSNDWLFAPVVDLANQAAAQLIFNERHTLEGNNNNHLAYSIVTPNDMDYYYAGVWAGSSNSPTWATRTYNLGFLAGKEVRCFWVVRRNGGSGPGGMWIDDVEVSGDAGTPPTLTIDSPASGASVSGVVPIEVTVSDDVDSLRLEVMPPQLSPVTYSPIPDNDTENPTKTFTINWDSRYVYNGGALLTVRAVAGDLLTPATIALNVNNSLLTPQLFDGFEDITVLGGLDAGDFDGDWFIRGGTGAAQWRIGTTDPFSGAQFAWMGQTGAGNYGNNQSERLYGPMHDLSAATNPYLRLRHKLGIGTGDSAFIRLVRYDGVQDRPLTLGEFRSNVGSWTELVFDLGPYKEDPQRLLFHFISNNDGNVGTGWGIDNYELIDADPQITTLTPDRVVPGTHEITIDGLRFGHTQSSSSVLFTKAGGGTTVATVLSWSDDELTVDLPADAATGDVLVRVHGHDSNGALFRVVLTPPTLDDLEQR